MEQAAPVPPAYRHHQRLITPGREFSTAGARLKWYELRRPDSPLPATLDRDARDALRAEIDAGRLEVGGQPGFAILHLGDSRGVPDSLGLLLISTWRHANELWESVYLKDLGAGGGFERFQQRGHLATFCTWELGIVWHERQAWNRYLFSTRDEAALAAYFADQLSSLV
jgi:hypothetical protein